jgi:hypothetical protein
VFGSILDDLWLVAHHPALSEREGRKFMHQGLQTHGTACAQYAYHPWCKYMPRCITRTAAYLTNRLFPGRLPVADFMIDSSLRACSSSADILPRTASTQWPNTIIGVLLRQGSTGAAKLTPV